MTLKSQPYPMTNQLNRNGKLTHLLTLEGMPKEQILYILDTAKQFVSVTSPNREVKKVPLLRVLLACGVLVWSATKCIF